METERKLALNYKEIMLLADRLKSPQTTVLGLKLAKAFLFLLNRKQINEKKLYKMPVSETEIWLISAVISPYDIDSGGKPLGLLLLKKVFRIAVDYSLPVPPEKWQEIRKMMKKGRKRNGNKIVPYRNSSQSPSETPD